MRRTLAQILVRLLACALVTWVVWLGIGTVAFAVCAPLFGASLARPLLEIAAQLQRALHAGAYADVNGRYFAFQGQPLRVVEDAFGQRWLATRDLRRIIDGFPSDTLLARLHPGQFDRQGTPPAAYLLDAAVLQVLQRATAPRTLRFKVWLERAVARPGRGVRERDARLLRPLPDAANAGSTLPPSQPAAAGT